MDKDEKFLTPSNPGESPDGKERVKPAADDGKVNLCIKQTKDCIAIVTAGGHVSCFHAGMLGIAQTAEANGVGVIGFKDGFLGAKQGKYCHLDSERLGEYVNRAGSIIGSSREKVAKDSEKGIDDPAMIKAVLDRLYRVGINVRGIIGMAGDDHLAQLHNLAEEEEIPVVGWPKTMDNDLSKTYHTLGYPTAAMNAARAIRQGQDGAWTNNKVHIVTMFGRDTDWIAAAAGAWGAADLVVGGESGRARVYDIAEIHAKAVQAVMQNKQEYGRRFAVIAVAEGASITGIESHVDESAKDPYGSPKLVPEKLALAIQAGFKQIDKTLPTSIDSLTYDTLRNCPPNNQDRVRAHQAGVECARRVIDGESDICIVMKQKELGGNFIGTAPLAEVARKRFLAPEGFMDYEKMRPTQALVDYYAPLFGEPLSKEKVLFGKLEERSV